MDVWAFSRPSRHTQNLVHRPPSSQFVDELIEIPDLPHEGVLHLLDSHPADHALDKRARWVQSRGLPNERLNVRAFS